MGERPATILPLELENVRWQAAPQAPFRLDGVSLRLAAGSRTVLLGPNGSGKTLTLRVAHGLLEPTEGAVRWNGPGGPAAALQQAMVFQRPVLLRRSVTANLTYALALRGISGEARRTRLARALEGAGLNDLATRSARTLSVGQQQRVALARAWALEPQVLFLDEPTASLDPGATQAVESTIQSIAAGGTQADGTQAGGTKIVMTTHDLGQARRLADDVVFLQGGRVTEHTPADEFFEAPRSAEARAFLKGDLFW
ncbi:MAG: ATP-binding cassette domain-containing protein [Myxococcales bacterium]|nr:ATP-binding cassette domain-containing protein [Myxococcales bacterium]